MKNEDLRIGNVVLVVYEGGNKDGTKNSKYMKISGVTSESIYFSERDNELIDEDDSEYPQTLPVKLTSEILECTNINDDFFAPKDIYCIGMKLVFETRRNWYRVYIINSKGQKTRLHKNIKYLHELQNLYPGLNSGDELRIDMCRLNSINK